MTVCIAALYSEGEGAVLASDKMITAHFPIGYEFEHGEHSKIISVSGSSSTFALVSGDVLRGQEILNAAQEMIRQRGEDISAAATAETIRSAYQQIRLKNISHRELEPRGLDLAKFYASHQQLAPHIVQIVDQALITFDLGVELLVVGLSETTHTIHTIVNPGDIYDNSIIGYGTIGSGSPHALYSLIENQYTVKQQKEEVVSLVKGAKERSEVAPGVGKQTSIVVLPEKESINEQPE